MAVSSCALDTEKTKHAPDRSVSLESVAEELANYSS